jgi:hypothetical protein
MDGMAEGGDAGGVRIQLSTKDGEETIGMDEGGSQRGVALMGYLVRRGALRNASGGGEAGFVFRLPGLEFHQHSLGNGV